MTTQSLAERREKFARHEAARAEHHRARTDLLSRPKRSATELQAIAIDAEDRFSPNASADEVLAWVAAEFGYRATVACSMADVVVPHVVAQHLPWVDTLFLETGYHFPETIGTRDATEASLELTIVDVLPTQTVAEQDAEYGEKLYERDPALCCQLRKVEPLTRTLALYEAWITGVRRDESPERANTPIVTWDEKNQLVKVNPLVDWSFDDLGEYTARHHLVTNPLIEDGYPSIGCAPCTRRVAAGEDPRSGRWAGFSKTECGLHT